MQLPVVTLEALLDHKKVLNQIALVHREPQSSGLSRVQAGLEIIAHVKQVNVHMRGSEDLDTIHTARGTVALR